MTHVIMVDDIKNSLTQGMEISVPVTVIETPAIRVAAVRAYAEDSTGEKAIAEVWAADLDPELKRRIPIPASDNQAEALENIGKLIEEGRVSDIKAVVYTLPKSLTGVPKKRYRTLWNPGSVQETSAPNSNTQSQSSALL